MNKTLKETLSKKEKKNQNYFRLGILMVFIGIIGLINNLWQTYNTSIDEILPESTSFFLEIDTQKISKKIGDDINILSFFSFLEKYEDKVNINSITPWAGSKASFGKIDTESFFAIRYRSKTKAKNFLKKTFLLENESFITEKVKNGTIYSPEFSGIFSFTFINNWMIVTENKNTLTEIITSDKKLSETKEFDTPFFSKQVAKGFFTSDLFKESDENESGFINTFGSLIDSGAFYVKEQGDNLSLSLNIDTNVEGLAGNASVIPELAQFADEDALFFMNGVDMYQSYLRTKTFLENIHPELATIFDGILDAESQEIFGPKFDFVTDFLSKMKGQYAILIDFDDPISPFINTTLITGFGKSDSAQKIKNFHETLRFAQGKFSTKIETVELPNGRTREELVATDPKEIVIEENSREKGTFYTTLNPTSNTEISYGFLENYFIFSTHRRSLENIFSGFFDPLTENKYFRNLVLLEQAPSESYGIVDSFKLGAALNTFTAEANQANLVALAQRFPKILFSRKVKDTEITYDFILTAQ